MRERTNVSESDTIESDGEAEVETLGGTLANDLDNLSAVTMEATQNGCHVLRQRRYCINAAQEGL